MRRFSAGLSLLVGLAVHALAAHSAPITGVQATLTIDIRGVGAVTASGVGTIDVTGGTISVPAGLVSLPSLTIPLTSFSSVNSLVVSKLSNLSATFSAGGATGQVTGETCPPASRSACVDGGGLGGVMGLTGFVFIHIVPNIVVIPLNLQANRIGQGGVGSGAWETEAGPWTTGVARVAGGSLTPPSTATGTNQGNVLSLVSPTFANLAANELPIMSTFTLDWVPEPRPLALLAFAAAGFLLLRSRRR